jgi:hypothetical protein
MGVLVAAVIFVSSVQSDSICKAASVSPVQWDKVYAVLSMSQTAVSVLPCQPAALAM